ncbi:MAG: crotonase/enoyl-CoA hydratase family protein [Polyangiaceae bacterium]|nr:crotonase/enoyl-CoA hydratase family protein [Polyangiaceae bacterium]
MSAPFETEKQDHVATLWLASPDRRNAMGKAFWDELPGVVAALDADDDVRAVVVAARGAHFSVGLDLVEMGAELGPLLAGGLAKQRRRLFDTIHRMRAGFDAIVASRKPFVAAVHGACIGGGLDLIAACDVRVCAADARFSLRETRIAIVADMGSLQRLRGVVGEGHLRELALTGKDIDAARAARIGLVNDVYPSQPEAHGAALALAREIASNSPIAVMGTKEVLDVSARYGAEAGLRYVAAWNSSQLASDDLAEAMRAFLERRPARFTGE